MEELIDKAGLGDILAKVKAGERISVADGVRLYQSPDLLFVGYIANVARERLNGDRAFYIYNQHINYSNICKNLCKFCAFGKDRTSKLAFELSVEEVKDKVRARLEEPIAEIHMVGGIHPDLPFSYYLELLRGIKKVRPAVHIQAFTCVEIAHLAEISGQSLDDTLEELKEAGLGSIPGGGAVVFSGPWPARRNCPAAIGLRWPRPRINTGCTAMPPCSTVTSRPVKSVSSIWICCGRRRMKPAAFWPTSLLPSIPKIRSCRSWPAPRGWMT